MFDYFGVLISVIMGLALTHLLRGLGRLMQLRHEAQPYWVHIVWTVNALIYVLAIWWGMYWWKDLQDWSAAWFFFIAAYAIVLFMWAYMLFPQEFSPDVNFESYFYANRRWLFGIQTFMCLMDIPETLRKGAMHLRPTPAPYPLFIASLLLISVVGLVTSRRRVHAVLCVAWLVIVLCYMFLSTLARIAGHVS